MKVHIVGSYPRNMPPEEMDSFKSACRDIGRVLATRKHEVVIAALTENTADRHVVEGMKEVEGIHNLVFYRRDDEEKETYDVLPKEKFSFSIKSYRGNRHINALAEGMAMLIIGGQGGTATAGFSAFALKRPVLAVPSFGGAGKDIWDAVSFRYSQSLTASTLDIISSKWTKSSANETVDTLEYLSKNNPFDERINKPQIFMSTISITMIFSWILLFSAGEYSEGWLRYLIFFLAIGVSSVIGTVTRTFLKVYFDVIETYSSKKLLSDFILGIIMGFCFFLFMHASGAILTGSQIPFNSSDFKRLVVLMSLITLSSSFLLERSIEKFRTQAIKYIDINVK